MEIRIRTAQNEGWMVLPEERSQEPLVFTDGVYLLQSLAQMLGIKGSKVLVELEMPSAELSLLDNLEIVPPAETIRGIWRSDGTGREDVSSDDRSSQPPPSGGGDQETTFPPS